jgi:hypothetical protein
LGKDQVEVAALVRNCQEVFMAAVLTFHTGKAVVQITATEMSVDHLLDIGPPESVLPGEMIVTYPDKGFKIVLYTAVVIRRLRAPGATNSGRSGDDFSPLRKSDRQ